MNFVLLEKYLKAYKENFQYVNRNEIYKWQVVKVFQDNWNINAVDFPGMLEASLTETDNLLTSTNYYPKRMVVFNARSSPEEVRVLFSELFDEEKDLTIRLNIFSEKFEKLNKKNHSDKPKDYQDHRAMMVYLTLRYPERYFLYKYGMFAKFCEKLEYPYAFAKGKNENVVQFLNVCQMCKAFLRQDQ